MASVNVTIRISNRILKNVPRVPGIACVVNLFIVVMSAILKELSSKGYALAKLIIMTPAKIAPVLID